jgi:hypothetical protein
MEDICYETRRARPGPGRVEDSRPGPTCDSGDYSDCAPGSSGCCLLLQDLFQSCSGGGMGIVEDMCYEIPQAEACVD